MTNEAKLISAAIQTRDLSALFERGVTDSWFPDQDDRRIWVFLRSHFSKYGECPSLEVVTENFPTYQVLNLSDSMDFLLDDLISKRRKVATSSMLREAIQAIEKEQDHEAALIALQRGMVKIEEAGLSTSTDVNLIKTTETRWDEYQQLKANPGLLGYATGFPTIDAATSGLQNGQLIVLVAPPKTGKSTLALQMARNIHKDGAVPLFQSFEMSNTEQQKRYDAMRAMVSHHRLITGSLTDEEESRYRASLTAMAADPHNFWLTDAANGQTVSAVASKIQTLQPDVVFIDGVYLMIDEQSGEANTPLALTNITRSLKRLAQRVDRPIVVSTQVLQWKMRKGKVTTDSIGYSSSFFQDADVLFGLEREDDTVDDTRILKVLAARNSGPTEASLLWDWNTGQFRELSGDDL
jgi:replicative DNA helicase